MAADPEFRYYESASPEMGVLWAVILDILSLAAFLFLCFRLQVSKRKVVRRIAMAIIGVFVGFAGLQALRFGADSLAASISGRVLDACGAALVAAAAVSFFWSRQRFWRYIQAGLLIMSPLFFIASANALEHYYALRIRPFDKGSGAGMLAENTHTNRFVWVIFDELDERLLFDVRPSRLRLSEFDNFRAQSIDATHAIAPNPDTTPSLLSLIVGGTITQAKLDTSNFLFRLKGCRKWENVSSYPNAFSEARAAGFDTGLSGWHHPYCRILGNVLSDCAWTPSTSPVAIAAESLESQPFLEKALYLAEWQAESFPFSGKFGFAAQPGGGPVVRRAMIAKYQGVMDAGYRMLRNKRINLVLIHVPIPHPPGIWDASEHKFTTKDADYLDTLQLADESLGRIRKELERMGDWDASTILVTSDHPYRIGMWHDYTKEMQRLTQMRVSRFIPFLLKMPRQQREIIYPTQFNTAVTASLAMAVLKQQVTSTHDAVRWLDAHAEGSINGPPCN
jgi:hypothetical protein